MSLSSSSTSNIRFVGEGQNTYLYRQVPFALLQEAEKIIALVDQHRLFRIELDPSRISQKLAIQHQRSIAQSTETKMEFFGHTPVSFLDINASNGKDLNPRMHVTSSLEIGIESHQGDRDYMEDTYLVTEFTLNLGEKNYNLELAAVFDGHGGAEVSSYLKAHWVSFFQDTLQELYTLFAKELPSIEASTLLDMTLYNGFKITTAKFHQHFSSNFRLQGSTAVITLLCENVLWTANVGDSRAVFVPKEGPLLPLSQDADLRQPYWQSGAKKWGGSYFLDRHGIYTLIGTEVGVNLSRSIGDGDVPGMNPRPKITRHQLDPEKGGWIVLASDGIWDLVNSRTVARAIQRNSQISPGSLARQIIDLIQADVLKRPEFFQKNIAIFDNMTLIIANYQTKGQL